jgi:hypothetical protein
MGKNIFVSTIACAEFVGQQRGKKTPTFMKQRGGIFFPLFCLTDPAMDVKIRRQDLKMDRW